MKLTLVPIYQFFGGVTEFYAFVFTVASIFFAYKNMLTATFVAAIGAIQCFVTANDVHNDLSMDKKLEDIHKDIEDVHRDVNKQPVDPDPDSPGGPH
jgi:hypothetical protein